MKQKYLLLPLEISDMKNKFPIGFYTGFWTTETKVEVFKKLNIKRENKPTSLRAIQRINFLFNL